MIKYLLVIAILLSACALPVAADDQNCSASSFFDVWFDVPGMVGGQTNVSAAGTAVVRRAKQSEATLVFDTEMLQMDLTGNSSVGSFILRESPTRQSLGRVWPPVSGDPDFDLLSVHSFFDVFLELDVAGQHLYNTQAAHFYGEANSASDITYHLDGDVQLYGVDGHVSVLKSGSTLDMTSVPEPSSVIALLGGFVGLLGMRRRRA